MDRQRWARIESLYHAALEKEPSKRPAYLKAECGDEPGLRREVESLLGCADTELRSPVNECQRWPLGFRLRSYEIIDALGAGGMGEVYRARDTKLRREVAIKVLPREFQNDPARLARFEREAQLLASLNHPNIGAIYGMDEAEGIRFLVLELVEGLTLSQRIASGPMTVAEALAIAMQIANALQAAHQKGVIHRDLKPANVKITPSGNAKVLDFGLATVAPALAEELAYRNVSESRELTLPSLVLGTPAYMSPEQANRRPVDPRTDIWAFGVVLFEMLMSARPFTGQTAADVLASVVHKEPDWARIPHRVRSLIKACLEKDPEERPRDFGEAMRLLDAVSVRISRHRRLPWAVAATLILGLAPFRLQQMNPDQPVPRRGEPAPEGAPFGRTGAPVVAFSPDGRYMITSAAKNGNSTIVIWRADGTSPTLLTGK
jgi:serine/threonine-protein kinase